MPTLEDAISLSVKAHHGRKDKAGASYILYPLRMMLRMRTKEGRIVALLHDVVEDTKYSIEDLRKAGYSEKILKAINHLTHARGEAYEQFIKRVKLNSLARKKISGADLNIDFNGREKISVPGNSNSVLSNWVINKLKAESSKKDKSLGN